jgi:WD40 repeat protein
MPPPPDPFHVLRTHSAPLASLAFGGGNTLLYSGDQDGFVSITDLRTRRSILFWNAHEGGVLGVGEWDGRLITSVPLSNPTALPAEMSVADRW